MFHRDPDPWRRLQRVVDPKKYLTAESWEQNPLKPGEPNGKAFSLCLPLGSSSFWCDL